MEELKSSFDLSQKMGKNHSNIMDAIRRLNKKDSQQHPIIVGHYKLKKEWQRTAKCYLISDYTWGTVVRKTTRWDNKLVDNYIQEHNLPIIRLSDSYNPHSMKWQCTVDGYIWDVEWQDIKNGESHCKRCRNNERWSERRILEKLSHPFFASVRVTFFEKPTAKAHVHVQCTTCAYTWDPIWESMLYNKQLCPRCTENLRMSRDLLVYRLKEAKYSTWACPIMPPVVTASTELIWICKKCGFVRANLSWTNLRRLHVCSHCHPPKHGLYTIPMAESKKEEWLLSKASVYMLHMSNTKEQFKKIGITSATVTSRFTGVALPYSYKVLHKIETNKYNATYIEKALHELHKEYKHTPNKYFAGYTECFTQLVPYTQEELDNKVQELKEEWKNKQNKK